MFELNQILNVNIKISLSSFRFNCKLNVIGLKWQCFHVLYGSLITHDRRISRAYSLTIWQLFLLPVLKNHNVTYNQHWHLQDIAHSLPTLRIHYQCCPFITNVANSLPMLPFITNVAHSLPNVAHSLPMLPIHYQCYQLHLQNQFKHCLLKTRYQTSFRQVYFHYIQKVTDP